MPHRPTVADVRLDKIIGLLTPTLTLLRELNDAFGPPFIQTISSTVEALINMVQNVKRNKNECVQLMEKIHEILYAIIHLHLKSETVGSLLPAMLYDIGKFTDTLHKIYTFLEAQQDGNRIKHLLRNNEMQTLLKSCHAGLKEAMDIFGMTIRPAMVNNIDEMKKATKIMHEELLELIHTLSDTSTSSDDSSVSESKNSSNSFSLLPSKPKIFHGRKSEVDSIIKMLSQQPAARIAILGAGGMGKTSLAKAVLHDPATSAEFEHRFFVSAEAATTSIGLAALIGLHLGLNPGQDLTRPILHYFSRKPHSLLILDNLETVWEPRQSRGGIEEFLSLLTEIEHLALIITMRGTEKPAKVRWTRPFLLPLEPLSDDAAQQIFADITDDVYTKEDIDQILRFTDNMPLAVDLIAHLSDYEGLSNVLARWETAKTSLFSIGNGRTSNLDASIRLSLASPRITSNSKELLSLLSILPEGLSDAELVQSNLGIPNILGCKALLQATSLAYRDSDNRLRSLVPIREHVQQFLPPSPLLISALRKYFYAHLELYQKFTGEQLQPIVKQITSNLGNLQEVLHQELYNSSSDLEDVIHCTLSLNSFLLITGHSSTLLMEYIHLILPSLGNHQLEIHFTIEILKSYSYPPGCDPEELVVKAIILLEYVDDPILKSKLYKAAGDYFYNYKLDPPQSMQFYQKALGLAKLSEDSDQYCNVLLGISQLKWSTGDYGTAQLHITETQRVSKLSANLFQEARSLYTGALCSTSLGNFQQSIHQLHRSREILGICGLLGGVLNTQITVAQGEVHLLKSEYPQARAIYIELIKTDSPDHNIFCYALSLLNLAHIDAISENIEDAYQWLNQARELLSSYKSQRGIILCDMFQAEIELREEKLDLARNQFEKCLHSAWGIDNEAESICLEMLADVKAWSTSEWQSKWPVIYCGYAYKSKDKLALHKALLFLGDTFINKDKETANNLYIVALAGFTQMDVHYSRAQCMIRLGDVANEQGQTSKATDFWKMAKSLFKQSLPAKNVAEIHARLSAVKTVDQKALLELAALNPPV
ncbi:hypothetical protein B0H14DRAFT_1295912 [Mycena olivaceomarginata]|nr:hypothetical protein B0H14DRAFT_1295912 [Mycena olivaceomarginata]